jgi:Ca-activated chloride channel family protein
MKNNYIPSRLKRYSVLLFALVLNFFSSVATAQEEETEDKTISPFFYVESSDSTVDQLPLKSTKVNVDISGVIADVTILQSYSNVGSKTIEAKYIFPMSTKAAVYKLRMIIGDRIMTAVVKEKEQAQEEYEEAIEQGHTATLLEQDRPNVMQMKVGNILPGDNIDIELRYTELITPVNGVYEFVYPTVVGPRYFGPSSDPSDSTWVEIPYTHEGEPPMHTFDIDVTVNGGMPVQAVSCPSHEPVDIDYLSETAVKVGLKENDSLSGNKDFILDYVLSGDKNEAGVLLYEGEEENFFLSMIQPPKSPEPTDVNYREYIFIVDVSGSMYGFPLEISKSLMTEVINGLDPLEKFNIICFAGGSSFLFEESKYATPENKESANSFIQSLVGGGGTNLLPALQSALSYPTNNEYSRIFVIATDGYVTVEKDAFDLIRNNLNKANFFTFGIGTAVNRYIIEGMAHAGMGEAFVVTNKSEAAKDAELFRNYIENPVLTGIKASFSGFNVYDVEPVTIPDVFAERPILIYGKWEAPLQGSIKLEGISGKNFPYSKTLNMSDYTPSDENNALRYLWARYKLQMLSDYCNPEFYSDKELYKTQIIDLGLKYNLLTEYTSFIAIDSLIRNVDGEVTTVIVPNPMPEGVTDNSIGWGGMTNSMEMVKYSGTSSLTKIVKAYPNPFISNLSFIIELSGEDYLKTKEIEIYNSIGQLVNKIDITSLSSSVNYLNIAESEFKGQKGIFCIVLKIDNKEFGSFKVSRE